MKERVSQELVKEGYTVFVEPLWAPSRYLSWVSYRPDLLGVRTCGSRQDYAFVECETRPSERRLASKNVGSVGVQTMLGAAISLRKILVIPRGKLSRVDRSMRRSWETWICDGNGVQCFPRV